jgi:response regulator RpfG family c-di-GMP phosphodiesterase
MLSAISGFEPVRDIVRNHHQRLDGSGYPAPGEKPVSQAAQIVAITNLFDGLLSDGENPRQAGQMLKDAATRGEFRTEVVSEFLREDERLPYRPKGPIPDWQELLTPLASSSPGRVAVVAATRANRDTLAHMLDMAGHTVLVLGSMPGPEEGLPAYDLAIFEPQTLDASAFQAIHRFKSAPGGAERPLLLCSGPHSRNDRQKAVEAGIDEFLPLPLEGLEVVARVKSLLRQQLYFRGLDEFRTTVSRIDDVARKNHTWWVSAVARMRSNHTG